MTRSRSLLAAVATVVALAVPVAIASPASAERLCVGVADPAPVGNSTTWVCSPDSGYYAEVITYVLSLKPV